MSRWLFLLVLFSSTLWAHNKTIYGQDDRLPYIEASHKMQTWADATAAMINHYLIRDDQNDPEIKHLAGWTLNHARNICPNENFAHYTFTAFCSGFLVTPTILITAGHCVSSQYMCDEHRWVFDYRADLMPSGDDQGIVKTKNIYRCKRVIKQVLDEESKLDFAIVELDRPVLDRSPLKLNTEQENIEIGTEVVATGHPVGMPMIVTPNGKVRDNSNEIFFTTTLDTFGGNSGSPVINSQTGLVEGVLVRGDVDYQMNEERGCYEATRCAEDECNGEEVTRISQLMPYLKSILN